jgi:hypothetical protein
MSHAPSWVNGEEPTATEKFTEKLNREIAATKQYIRGTGHLPVNHEQARLESANELFELQRQRFLDEAIAIDKQLDPAQTMHTPVLPQEEETTD